MSCSAGPNAVTTGLVFEYDMNNTQKSWKGAPVTNMVSASGIDMSVLTGYTDTSVTKVIDYGSPSGYAAESQLVGAYIISARHWLGDISGITTLTGNAFISVYAKQIAGNTAIRPASYTGTQWVTLAPLDGGSPYLNNSYRRFGSYSSYGTGSSGPRPSVSMFYNQTVTTSDIVRWHSPQMESTTFVTPYINGARTTTQALLDLTNNNTLTASSLTYASGNTFSFDGTSNSVILPENTAFNTQTPSVEVWVKTNALSQNGFFFEKGTVNTQYSFFQEGGNIVWRHHNGTTYTNLTAVTANYITTSQYAHIVGTYTSGSRKIYINGVEVATDTSVFTIPTNANGCSIGVYGGYSGSRGYYFNGTIGSVKVYNRALSAAEVSQNFNAIKGRYGL